MKKYFYTDGLEKFGPFSKEELLKQNISRNTRVWCFGYSDWRKIGQLHEFKEDVRKLPPEIHLSDIKERKITSQKKVILLKDSAHSFLIQVGNFCNQPLARVAFLVVFGITLVIVCLNYSKNNEYREIVKMSYEGNEDFSTYLDKFYRDLSVYGIYPDKSNSVSIKFSNLDKIITNEHVHGISFGHDNDEIVEIYINPASWEKFSKPMRYRLIYHELAHDILNLDDLERNTENSEKLMFPVISSHEVYTMDEFINSFHELFEEISQQKPNFFFEPSN